MSGFSPDWLALREPFDAAARSTALVTMLRRHVVPGTAAAPLDVVDLGAGAGANLRYLAPLLGGAQRWRLVDDDAALLDAAVATTQAWAAATGARTASRGAALAVDAADVAFELRCERRDLRELHGITLPVGGVVTAAALLDLVSRDWLTALAGHCRAARAIVAFALTYDGRAGCTPREADDEEVRALFNAHQLGDKGFGPALGPGAASATAEILETAGYRVVAQPSDWVIGRTARAMQLALLDGWLAAALEMAPARAAALRAWHARRRAHVEAGRSELRVGHVDVIAWL